MAYKLRYVQKGEGEPIVLLHGLISSHHYWDLVFQELSSTHKVVALDLLGFGKSPKPRKSGYTTTEHIESIDETLRSICIDRKVTLVGYSMGANIAISYAHAFPDKVSKLVLITPPLFRSSSEAKNEIMAYSAYFRLMQQRPFVARLLSNFNYRFRAIAKLFVPFFIHHLPRHIAAQTVMHTGRSFLRTTEEILVQQRSFEELMEIEVPIRIAYGKNDAVVNSRIIQEVAGQKKNIMLFEAITGHQLPLDDPNIVVKAIVS